MVEVHDGEDPEVVNLAGAREITGVTSPFTTPRNLPDYSHSGSPLRRSPSPSSSPAKDRVARAEKIREARSSPPLDSNSQPARGFGKALDLNTSAARLGSPVHVPTPVKVAGGQLEQGFLPMNVGQIRSFESASFGTGEKPSILSVTPKQKFLLPTLSDMAQQPDNGKHSARSAPAQPEHRSVFSFTHNPAEFLAYLLDGGEMKEGQFLAIVKEAIKILKELPNVCKISYPVIVVGSLHGMADDFLTLEQEIMRCTEGTAHTDYNWLFLGNYLDHGPHGPEMVAWLILMCAFKSKTSTFLRGYSETAIIAEKTEFREKFINRFSKRMYDTLLEFFNCLPLAAEIGEDNQAHLIAMSGGISPDIAWASDIKLLERCREPASIGPMCDLLFSGPMDDVDDKPVTGVSYVFNDLRKCSVNFSKTELESFLDRNCYSGIIRAGNGPASWEQKWKTAARSAGGCISLFSAPSFYQYGPSSGGYSIIRRGQISLYKSNDNGLTEVTDEEFHAQEVREGCRARPHYDIDMLKYMIQPKLQAPSLHRPQEISSGFPTARIIFGSDLYKTELNLAPENERTITDVTALVEFSRATGGDEDMIHQSHAPATITPLKKQPLTNGIVHVIHVGRTLIDDHIEVIFDPTLNVHSLVRGVVGQLTVSVTHGGRRDSASIQFNLGRDVHAIVSGMSTKHFFVAKCGKTRIGCVIGLETDLIEKVSKVPDPREWRFRTSPPAETFKAIPLPSIKAVRMVVENVSYSSG